MYVDADNICAIGRVVGIAVCMLMLMIYVLWIYSYMYVDADNICAIGRVVVEIAFSGTILFLRGGSICFVGGFKLIVLYLNSPIYIYI